MVVIHSVTVNSVSQHTKDRIKAASILDVASDEDLVSECDIIFSIVPPRDAIVTAKRIHDACKTASSKRRERNKYGPLMYVDMNAVSPRTTKRIDGLFVQPEKSTQSLTRRLSRSLSMTTRSAPDLVPEIEPVLVKFLDGGIIGGPPALQNDESWKKPSVIVSGPRYESLTPDLSSVLNIKHVSEEIGAASTLKACFASFGKGILAIAITSFTTAHTAGVLNELQDELQNLYPGILSFVKRGMPGVPPKAYRWVDEMRQIGETFSDQGHFESGHQGQAMFEGVSEIYKFMADETVLGKEVIGKRKRGTTVEDVAEGMREGIEAKRVRKPTDEKLELAWRGSWS